jgi:hypothetical protein
MRKVLSKKKVVIPLKFIICVDITYATLLLSYNYIINACFAKVYNTLIDYSNYITYINAINKL